MILALEVIQALSEGGYRNRHPWAVAVFTGEEPNPFGLSTLGSRLLTGVLSLDTVRNTAGLPEALAAAGGDVEGLAALAPDLAAFIEPHIEQGPRLDEAGVPLAVVEGITGIHRDRITLSVEQNHAGTTPMARRRDAVAAFSEAAMLFEKRLLSPGFPLVGTIGQVTVYPNAVNVVPGLVEFVAEMRSPDTERLRQAAARYRQELQALAGRRRISATVANLLDQPASQMDPGIRQVLAAVLDRRGVPYQTLYSLAGHDATHLSRVVPTGMLFVRSRQGKSHCPDEWSAPEDIRLAAETLAEAWIQLDGGLTREGREPHGLESLLP
ncbi:MAG: hydantoinase/carbamoylase family amidase [Thermaerobacter sp.]|nr:hydantoinase/carbamoylase family amidase [Thermaerobacter sp.]